MAEEPRWRVVFYTDGRGKSPVMEFLRNLKPTERAEAENAFRLLREFGTMLGMPHARSVRGHSKLWELRPGPNRIFYFAHMGGHLFCCTHTESRGRRRRREKLRLPRDEWLK